MEGTTPTESVIKTLRSIAGAGFTSFETMVVCTAAGWPVAVKKPDLGHVQFRVPLAVEPTGCSLLTVLTAEHHDTPLAFLPLFCFGEYGECREPFDKAYRDIRGGLVRFLGAASAFGEYIYPHRAGWLYSFTGWSLADATLVLVQDEFDIQFGMDITLWVRPANTAIVVPVRVA